MSATNRGSERKAYDFYATPPEAIRAFLANFDGISSGDRILEPSAGNGQLIKVLRESGYDKRAFSSGVRKRSLRISSEIRLATFAQFSWISGQSCFFRLTPLPL